MRTGPASVMEAVKDAEYPAEKRDLVEHVRLHGANKEVLEDIKNLLDKVYTSTSEVTKELENIE
jgi:hypothetical protein